MPVSSPYAVYRAEPSAYLPSRLPWPDLPPVCQRDGGSAGEGLLQRTGHSPSAASARSRSRTRSLRQAQAGLLQGELFLVQSASVPR